MPGPPKSRDRMVAYRSFPPGLLKPKHMCLDTPSQAKRSNRLDSAQGNPPETAGGNDISALAFQLRNANFRLPWEFLTRSSFLSIEFFLDRSAGPVDLGK